MGGID
jgi:hypothetical protein